MTTIAIDKFGTIAADGLACLGDERHRTNVRKITVRPGTPKGDRPPRIFALAGPGAMTDALIAWYEAGANPREVPPPCEGGGWTLVVIEREGAFYVPSNGPYKVRFEIPYAFGSGSSYALSLLKEGYTAERAIEVVASIDLWTGGEIQVENIAEALARKPALLAAAE